MHRISRLKRDESGFSLVFVGLGLMALFAAGMIAIDVGMLMTARNQAQNAADAGALAGATALAFDNWDDRTPSGPAFKNAVAAAQANLVVPDPARGESGVVSVLPEDVEFLNSPTTGEANRVRVNVWRTAARGNPVSTLVARAFLITSADIGAVATAEASPANAMTCVKPFTIPDKWIELNPVAKTWEPTDGFSRYDKKGNLLNPADKYEPAYDTSTKPWTPNPAYSGYNQTDNLGVKLVLRAGQNNQIQPSFYFSLAMTGDTGGDDYEWNIANCNHTIYHWNDALVQEPGDKQGPTIKGIQDLIDRDPGAVWDDSKKMVVNSAFPGRTSPRIFPIPLYDPDYYDLGKQTGRVASLRVGNWIGFFVEYIGNGSEIHGRIIPIAGIYDRNFTGGTQAFPRAIRLVQ